MEKISIIIPVYNNPEGLAQTVESIERLKDDHFELIVVDDASSVSYDRFFKEKKIHWLRLPENSGPGYARNKGVQLSEGGILAFTDSDCTVPPDWLSKIRQAMEDPSVVAVAGGYSQEHVTSLVTLTRYLEADYYHLKEKTWVNSFITSNFAIRRPVFEAAGGFPPLYFCEDLVLGVKLKEKGWDVLWLPELQVGQYFRPTFLKYVKQQFHWSYHVALVSGMYPQTQLLNWSVNRSYLAPQLLLEGVLLFSPFFLHGKWLLLAWIGALLGLLGLNLPFLVYAFKKSSFKTAVGIWMVVVGGRNLAWFWGCLGVLLFRPRIMIPGLAKMAVQKITSAFGGTPRRHRAFVKSGEEGARETERIEKGAGPLGIVKDFPVGMNEADNQRNRLVDTDRDEVSHGRL